MNRHVRESMRQTGTEQGIQASWQQREKDGTFHYLQVPDGPPFTAGFTPYQVYACQMMVKMHSFDRSEDQVLWTSRRRSPVIRGITKVRRPFPAIIVRQPVRSKRKQSRRQNLGDG